MSQKTLAGANVSTSSLEIARRVNRDSELQEAKKYRGKVIQRVPIDLGVLGTISKPLEISFPFDALEVIAFTDATGANDFVNYVKLAPGSKDNYNVNNFRECRLGEVVEFDQTQLEARVYIDAALVGSNCTLVFYLGAKARSSAINAKITGFLSQTDGSARNSAGLTGNVAVITVGAAATKILDADGTRALANLRVEGGDILIGDIAVGTVPGQGDKRTDGERWDDRNTGALYAIALSGAPKIYGLVNK